jgi:hypothetical protein
MIEILLSEIRTSSELQFDRILFEAVLFRNTNFNDLILPRLANKKLITHDKLVEITA